MPAWLVELTRADGSGRDGRTVTQPNVWTAMLGDGIPEGRRNASLHRLAGHLLRRWIDVDVTADLVHLVNEARCRPPLLRSEVDHVVDSAAQLEVRRLRKRGR